MNLRSAPASHPLPLVSVVLITALTLLSLAPAARAQRIKTLHSFTNPNSGSAFEALVQGTDGNFYGTTDGVDGYGTVFKLTPDGTLTTLYAFNHFLLSSDGANPRAALVQGTDGNFYGTASEGGTINNGTVFKITPTGTLTSLYSFTNSVDGNTPDASLIQASDGNFYGTTLYGGSNDFGTVFKITASGTFTVLHTFTGVADGGNSNAALIQGKDGNFYGTTSAGGADGYGTIFKMTPSGMLITLHTFTGGTDGLNPYDALVQGTDGNFYGNTFYGGSNDYGTIFKIRPDGVFTTLYAFASRSDGFYPSALIQATDGNFYGSTFFGGIIGINGYGTIFKMTPSGVLTTLYTFTGGSDGFHPSPLIQSNDGSFFGMTSEAGASGYGTLFRLNLGASWRAVRNSVGSDGNTHVLWDKDDGTAAVRTINPAGTILSVPQFGPFPGWTAAALSVGSDSNTRLLWDKNDGTAALWTLNPTGTIVSAPQFGPFRGWTATALSAGAGGNTQLLWEKSSGMAALWTINPAGTITNAPQFGPYAGWTAMALSVGADGNTRLLWNNTNGTAALWTVNPAGTILNAPQYGPFSGWTATALSVGADNNAHLLWNNANGMAALWTVNAAGAIVNAPQFGPFPGWAATSLSVGADGSAHLLWDNANGVSALWTVDATGKITNAPQFGPYN